VLKKRRLDNLRVRVFLIALTSISAGLHAEVPWWDVNWQCRRERPGVACRVEGLTRAVRLLYWLYGLSGCT
jgi:hypothetical protein